MTWLVQLSTELPELLANPVDESPAPIPAKYGLWMPAPHETKDRRPRYPGMISPLGLVTIAFGPGPFDTPRRRPSGLLSRTDGVMPNSFLFMIACRPAVLIPTPFETVPNENGLLLIWANAELGRIRVRERRKLVEKWDLDKALTSFFRT